MRKMSVCVCVCERSKGNSHERKTSSLNCLHGKHGDSLSTLQAKSSCYQVKRPPQTHWLLRARSHHRLCKTFSSISNDLKGTVSISGFANVSVSVNYLLVHPSIFCSLFESRSWGQQGNYYKVSQVPFPSATSSSSFLGDLKTFPDQMGYVNPPECSGSDVMCLDNPPQGGIQEAA